MPGLVYATGIGLGTEKFSRAIAADMALIAFGVLVCALGEVNLVVKGLFQQLLALVFEVTPLSQPRSPSPPAHISPRLSVRPSRVRV